MIIDNDTEGFGIEADACEDCGKPLEDCDCNDTNFEDDQDDDT